MIEIRYCLACAGELVLRREGDRERLGCPGCGRIHYQNPIPASVAVVFDTADRVLLVCRAAPPQRGAWCLPGGFLELGESGETGSLRELREETGLEGAGPIPLGSECSPSLLYGPLVVMGFLISQWHGVLLAGDDAAECRFFGCDELPKVAFVSHRRLIERALVIRGERRAGEKG